MAREHNYLLGQGERLTQSRSLSKASRPKNPPYDFHTARDRLVHPIQQAAEWTATLPSDACPSNQVVLEVVLHPRYLSKSDQPHALLGAVGLKTIGRRAIEVSPDAWGIKNPPARATTDKLFVSIARDKLVRWAAELPVWDEKHVGAHELTQVESISPFFTAEKLFDTPSDGSFLAELVLHNAGQKTILDDFLAFARSRGAEVLADRKRVAGWLSFLPVRLSGDITQSIAEFTFVRAIRQMPRMRAVLRSPMRSFSFTAQLPDLDAASSERTVIFDGGIPSEVAPLLARWVNVIEPTGIGPSNPDMLLHGLAVTSSFLFGPLKRGKIVNRPVCNVDHVRVLDDKTGHDLEYYDVLGRITEHLDLKQYRFACLSLGPNRAISDDEVTAWTAELDLRLAHGTTLLAVAVGNDGDLGADLGLNRIQPPSDGVNAFAIGASDSRKKKWGRASYSCVGPGRSPGIFKPDGLAFGGTDEAPFEVIGPGMSCLGVTGTSFAAPFALRSCAGVASIVDADLRPLTIRALAIHRAELKARQPHSQVGWGRILEDPVHMITCDDCECVVVYEGDLPLGEHLRAKLAFPSAPLTGGVRITATLAIAPEVDPEHASTYTRGGLGITFRPDATNFQPNERGVLKSEPETMDFFNSKRLKGRVPEYMLRTDAHKWEPVVRATRTIDASKLNQPYFDIYYNRRERGSEQKTEMPLRYALIITVRCENVKDLYQQVLTTYATVLAPLQTTVDIKLTV